VQTPTNDRSVVGPRPTLRDFDSSADTQGTDSDRYAIRLVRLASTPTDLARFFYQAKRNRWRR
jgi:hypothetical protein